MKIKPLLERLTNNWPAKAVCILIACLFYIFNRYASLEQKSIPVTLRVRQDGEMVCTTHIPSSVSVTVRTSEDDIARVSAEGITANLDLSYITKEGNYDVPVFVDLPSSIMELDPLQVTVYPEKISVHLEKNTLRTVRVLPQLSGTVPYGYDVKSVESEPAFVSIYGPRTVVEGIDSVLTDGVSVEKQEGTFSAKTKIVNLNRLVQLRASDEATVTVNMDYAEGKKEFKRRPVVLKNLPSAFETSSKFTGNFTVRGPQLVLDDFEPNTDTLSVDLSSVTQAGEYELPVEVLLPQEFRLENVSIENVKVVVQEREPAIVIDETDPNFVQNDGAENAEGENASSLDGGQPGNGGGQ